MTSVSPLKTLLDRSAGKRLELPPALEQLYGELRVPAGERYVYANFVSTLDGVVSLGADRSGVDISGGSKHDRFVMGLLRAIANVVVTGAGTLRSVPKHLWTADYIYPDLADDFAQLRQSLGKHEPPLNVIVSASGDLDPSLRVFQGEVPALVVTTERGAERCRDAFSSTSVDVVAAPGADAISANDILAAIATRSAAHYCLLEAGPRLMAGFLAERLVDELFLTFAPQIAGRDGAAQRPGLVAGRSFAPDDPRWGSLVSAKLGDNHLLLRYSLREKS